MNRKSPVYASLFRILIVLVTVSAPLMARATTTATPAFSLAAGSYTGTQSVTLSDTTSGATIYYTTNGTTPTSSSTKYTAAISVSTSETIKAIAELSGDTNSAVASAAYTITVPTPTFSPAAGTYTSTQSVTISDATSGTTCYYTLTAGTTGTTPTTSSTKYTSAVSVTATSVLEALCTLSGDTNSAVASAKFTITPTVATPTFSLAAGNYTGTQAVTLSDTTSGATIYYTTNGTTPTSSSTKYTTAISVSTSETIEAIAEHSGDTNSAVASAAYTITVPTPTFSPVAGSYTSTQSVTISDATSGTTCYYTLTAGTTGTTPTTSSTKYTSAVSVTATSVLEALCTLSGDTNSAAASAAYTITATVATPTFSPAAGNYAGTQSVTLSDTTSGATIYYTTNGTTPTSSSTKYTAAISVSTSETIKAIAELSGDTNSAVASAAYTITVPTPTISPAAGSYTSTQSVTISDATSGATCYYTVTAGTTGTTPTTSSTTYTSAISVTATSVLEALCTLSGDTNSSAASAAYTITEPTAPTPTFSPAAGNYPNGDGGTAVTVTISDTNSAATIYYTLTSGGTGTTPTTSSSVYTAGSIGFDSDYTLEAMAVVPGYSNSIVATAVYTVETVPPTFSLTPGSYVGSQSVTITDGMNGVKIYYTTNGTTPTTSSTKYTAAITVSSSETIEAIATYSGYSSSPVESATYTITSAVATPSISPATGAYANAQLVTISESSLNATIYYTVTSGTTGTTPTTSSTPYTGAITVGSTETLEAIAAVTGYTSSPVATATYTLPASAASTTALAVTSGGSPVTSVASGNAVTLTATVASGTTAVTTGTVNFCDATATYCTDIHLLGTAQLTRAGTAAINLLPGIGSHSYKAIFVGTSSYVTSSSVAVQLMVTGRYPTTTTFPSIFGSAGDYTLLAAVQGIGSNVGPTGTVSLLDTNNANAVLGTASLSIGAADLSFANGTTVSIPGSVSGDNNLVAVGDFNRDGKQDMALMNGNLVTILLSNGDGTFTQANGSPITVDGAFVAVGDFNGDGKQDLAVLSTWGSLTTLLGNGDGTFAVGNPTASVCPGPISLAMGDFNRDGKLDLAMACDPTFFGGVYSVIILLGNGDGTFTQSNGSPISFSGNDPSFVAVGDFNGDGTPDLAVADYGGAVTILLGNGDGTFTQANGSPITISSEEIDSLAVGDFNGDGKLDLAVTSYYYPLVYILLGNGDGTFTQTDTPYVGNGPYSVAVGNFNNNGIPDLAVANNYDNTVRVLVGNGDGTFSQNQLLNVGTGPQSVAVGYFNGGGTPELAVVNLGVSCDDCGGQETLSTVNVFQTKLTDYADIWFSGVAPVGNGTHNVNAVYGGDGYFSGSTSATTPLTAVPYAMSASLVPAESWFGNPAAVNITMWPQNGAVPTGTVSCSGAGVTSASVTVSLNGSATVQMNGLPLGEDSIVCWFISSNSNRFSNAASSTMIESVSAMPNTGSVSVAPSSATLYGGQSLQFVASIFNTGNQAVTWSVSPSGAGTIGATGFYTAPATVTSPQTIAITAISQANTAQLASAMITLSPPPCAASGYSYQRSIVIDHTKVPNTDQADFPFLFNTTDPVLKTTANGGHVTNSNGYDIIFSTDPGGLTKLDHELEEYNPVTGQVIAWVRIPTLSHTTDTVLYVFYGNSSITTSQQNPTGVWDSNHTAVYHLANVVTGIAADSTANGNNGTLASTSAASGEIDGAAGFNGTLSFVQIPAADFASYPTSGSTTTGFSASFGAWFKTSSGGVILGQTDGTEPGGNPGGWQPALYIDTAGLLRASVFSHGGATDQIVTATAYNDNNWHFAVDTYTNGTEELYVDGQFAGSQQVPELGYSSAYAYFVGTGETANWPAGNGSWLYFNGTLDEVNVSKIARSGDWVQTEYSNQSSPSTFYALYPENAEEVIPATVSLSASQSQQFTVLGSAAGSCSSPDVIWSMPSGLPGTLTASGLYTAPNSIGTQQTVTITGITLGDSTQSISSTVTLIPAVTVSVTPGSVTLGGGQTQQFTASVNNTSNAAVTWTFDPPGTGSFSAGGTYTAPASVTTQQTVTITATSQADTSQSASATITLATPPPALPVSVSVNPPSAVLYAGQIQQFAASVANTNNTVVTWTIAPAGVGTLSASGLYAAPATVTTQQTVTITATSQADPTQSAVVTVTILPTPCGSTAYSYVRTIAIDHTKVPNTDQTNFPFLFNTTNPTFATIANGGQVANSNGYDIVFTSDSAGQNILNYEVEQYNPVTGQVVAWVSIPTLSHASDTLVYVFYGNPSITTSQQNPSGVWDSNFNAVYHLKTTSTGTSVADSTANGNSGIAGNNGIALPTEGTGVFGAGAGSFNGSQGIYLPSFAISTFTVSAWIFPTISGDTGAFLAGPIGAMEARQRGDNTLDLVDEDVVDMGASSSLLTMNAWNHVAISYDGATASLFINGAPSGTNSISQSFGSGNYYIGEAQNGENFIGNIDQLKLSTSVRSSDWIATEYNNQNSPSAFYSVSTENGFAVSPESADLYASQSQQFVATGVCNTAATWTMPAGAPGTLSPSGLYTAPAIIATQQTVTITATNQAVPTTTAMVTVTLMPPVAVSVTPASTTMTDDQTQQFTASVINSGNLDVIWTISPAGVGTISGAGLYSAPSTITTQQTLTITATSQEDSTKSASATITLSPTQCALSEFGYQRVIVIDHTKVPNTDQTNFPFLFNTTDPDLATTANGGHVTSSTGNDIIFSTDPNGLTKLDHEMEEYNPVTGQVVAWMRIPTLSHTTDTVLYIFYGNPNIIASQQNPTGVWNSNYQAVYHLANVGTIIATDSTGYGNNGTLSTVSAASGEIDGAASFNGASSYMQIPPADFPSYPTGAYNNLGLPNASSSTSYAASFGVWFKTASAGGILAQVPSLYCTASVFGFCIDQSGTVPGDYDPEGWNPMLYVDDKGSLVGGGVTTATAYNDSNWHFAVLTYATDGTDTLYVDGQSVGSTPANFPTGYSSGYAYFVGTSYSFLADDGNWNWLYLNGSVDEVSVSNSPFSGDWIQTEFNNQGSPSTFYKLYPRSTIQVAPSAVSLYASESQQFAVPGSCDAAVTWTMPSGAPGALTSAGLYIAPGSVSAQQTVTITASSVATGTAIGSATVTLLAPASPITLAAAARSPYATGSPQTFTAAVSGQDGTPVSGVPVNFTVTGANPNLGSATTNSNGTASYTYTGTNIGTDTIQATASVEGQLVTASSISATWIAPISPGTTEGATLTGPPALGPIGLVGAFTNSNGAVIEPIAIGASQTEFVVPAGATQLQLGVNDNRFATDGGPGFIVAVNGVPVNVPPTALPWNWAAGGLNANYQFGPSGEISTNYPYGPDEATNPIVAAAGLTPGGTVTVAYQSGTASANFPTLPLVNANGEQSDITGVQISQGTYYPTLYTTTSSYPVGQPISFNAVVTNASGAPIPNTPVTLSVTGANPQQLQGVTDSTGTAAFLYSGIYAGADSLQTQAFPLGGPTLVSSESTVTWINYPAPPSAGTIALSLFAYINDVQTYTVLVSDSFGNPLTNANLGFYVWGTDNFVQTGTTDVTGHASFNYDHANPGPFNVAVVDSANRNVVFSNVISGTWTPPASTSGCSNCNTVTVSITAQSTLSLPGTLQLTGTVTDSVGINPTVLWTQIGGPGLVTFAAPQQSSTSAAFSEPGIYVLQLSASDTGASASAQFQVTVSPAPATGLPQGWIGSPLYGSTVSGLVPITLAPGISLQSGLLTYFPTNNAGSVTVLNANTTGSGQIALLDTTTLANGSYWIELYGTETGGESEHSLLLVNVTGNFKPGRVTATVTDLVVPATGLAISIQRTYDSLNAGTIGDFGYGWNLGINVNLSVGPDGSVTFTLGGQRRTFYLTPQPNGFLPYDVAAFTPQPGFFGTLTDSAPGCADGFDFLVPDGSLWFCVDGGQYNPPGYVYTDPNGTSYTISGTGGLQAIQDRSGNGLTITPNGITSTTGLNVPFVRDSLNRITQITDPQGNQYVYTYDANGNLSTVTYPNTTQPSTYTYNANHLYLSGTDFRNDPLPVTTYYTAADTDPNGLPLNGRPETVTDGLGETTSYAYNLATNTTIITYPADANGNTGNATMVYDSYGMLLSSTDPLGDTTTNVYNANHSLVSVTDPLGHVYTYTYDQNGNKNSSTYPATATSTNTTSYFAYNQYSEQTSTTDELGNVRTYNYDANYNPQNVIDGIGVVASFVFNANSMLQAGAAGYDLTVQPAMASQYAYDSNGNLASSTDALGRTTSYTYDWLGHKLSMTVPLPNSGAAGPASTTNYQYDALGNLIQTAAPLGSVTGSVYDGNGNRISSTDALGNVTTYKYDALNRLIETDYPSNSTTPATKTTRTYDFRNNMITATDQDGNVTLNAYDLAGHLTSVTRGYGTSNASTTAYTYYADGRKQTETDPLGHTTTNTYDAAGRLTTVTTAAGSNQYVYDNAGNQISTTDANNHTTQFQYDARKRLVKTTYPDATTATNAYNGVGNVISVTDQAGNIVQSNYDAANQLKTVVEVDSPNTSNNTSSYAYDNDGNQASMTDENGHTTASTFDVLSRLASKILPDGSLTETRQYDTDGNLLSLTHFNGVTTTFTYDALNRLLTRATPGETTVSFTYTAAGMRNTMTDGSGTTTYSYDSLDRLSAKATPEGTLSYTYDAAANVASMTSSNSNGASVSYTYDDVGRLSTVVDNRLTGNNTTTYTYDPASNLATATYPNGLQSTFTYDELNRLTALSAPTASYSYQLGATGNRTQATESTGRTVNWTYDGIYRLTNEAITSDPADKDGSIAYGLDPVGNRQSETSTLSGLNPGTFSYNSDDEASTDTYDNNGNTLATDGKSFSYDPENHLMSMNGSAVTLLYDGDGNRVAETASGVTTKYLVDDLNLTGYPQVVDELVGGAVDRVYTYGLQRIGENQIVNSAWTPSFYGYDGEGTVRQLASAAGTVTDTYEYDAFGNEINHAGTTPNNYLYRGEQFDPDLSLYYLRARYYNQLTGRFLSVDSQAGEGQRRYEYADADPVNGMDPSGNDAIIEFELLNFQPSPIMSWPHFCWSAGANPMGGYFPGCGSSRGFGGPGGPPPPPHWIVWVNWRPLLKFSNLTFGHHPLGHWHHTYISIYNPALGTETWGVLGENGGGKNQQVLYDDPRNNSVGGGETEISCSDSEAQTLEGALNATDYASGRECPSCGKNYHNWWWRHPPDGNNSNTYTFNMIHNWGKTPPTELNAPGYELSSGYAGYF
jgi:RHS repeat-associated protein